MKKLTIILIIISILILVGCGTQSVKYQCADGSFVDSKGLCPKINPTTIKEDKIEEQIIEEPITLPIIEDAPDTLCADALKQCNEYGECELFNMLKLQGVCVGGIIIERQQTNEDLEKALKDEIITSLNLERCKGELTIETFIHSCQYQILLELGQGEKCNILPKKGSTGNTVRDACYLGCAKRQSDRELCKKIEDERRLEECNHFFKIIDSSSKGIDTPVFEGDDSNIPEFMAVREEKRLSEIIWWAKDFEITKVEKSMWKVKIHIKTKNDNEKIITMDMGLDARDFIFDDDPLDLDGTFTSCKDNPSCNGIPWIYETEFDLHGDISYDYIFYCPNNIEHCKTLIGLIKDYNTIG